MKRAGYLDSERVADFHRRRLRRGHHSSDMGDTSFAVANAIAVPLTGLAIPAFWRGQAVSFASIVLFTIASFLCGLSSTLQMLITFRVIQGAVAGPMIPSDSQALLAVRVFPKAKGGYGAGPFGAMTTLVAPVTGPMLGGWITDNISWPWIFYINIPVGAFAAIVTWGVYKNRETPRKKLPIDGRRPRNSDCLGRFAANHAGQR